ncbi:MAG: sialidase family protein, partial [Gemmatimonadota bacterium]
MSKPLTFTLLVAIAALAAIAARGYDAGTTAPRAVVIDTLPSPAAPGSAEPNLTVGAGGRVYMSWLEPADSGHALKFAIWQANRWSPPRTIRSGRDFFANWADFPSIIVLGDGHLAAHWLQRTGGATYAYGVRIAQSHDDGRTWSAPVTPHRDSSPTEHGFVALWRENGRLGAAWLDGRKFAAVGHDASNEMMLLSTIVAPNGTLGAEIRLDERTCDCCQNSAALTSNGPIVAYRNRSHDEIRDIYVTRRVGGRWLPGAAVHDDNWKIAACPVNGPAIAASGRRVAVAWFTAADDDARVKVAFSRDAGATFAAPIRVDGGNPAGRVDVALLQNGDALVTWIERTGGENATVRARRVRAHGRLGDPVS